MLHFALLARLPRLREFPHYITSALVFVGQRHAFLKPCATFLMETRAFQGLLQFAIPAGVTLAGTHSLSGATTEVKPVTGYRNPAAGEVNTNFTWLFTTTGANRAESFTVSGLPAGLTYRFGAPAASITGKPTAAGSSKVTIKGWENSNRTGASTPVYTLTLNVTSPVAITSLSSGGAYPAGASVSLTVTASGAGLTYQWKHDNVSIPGAVASTYAIASFSEATAGTYSVVVTSGALSVPSGAITLTLKPAFIVWQEAFWSGPELLDPLVSGLGADPDGDGLENVFEYVLGLNPTTVNPNSVGDFHADSGSPEYLLYEVPLNPNATDHTVQFQRSSDLSSAGWETIPEADPTFQITRTPSMLSVRIPKTAGGGFLRLVATFN